MKIGLLIFDNDSKRTVAEKIRLAAERYEAKHGRPPNACYVNPQTLGDLPVQAGLLVVPARNILPHHFWIGINEASEVPERLAA